MNGDFTRPRYPVFLDLNDRLVVVFGGGTVAEGAIRSVLTYGADVSVVAPLVTPWIDALVAEGLVYHEDRGYVRGDLAGAFMVVCATDSVEVDRAVYQEAEAAGCLVNTMGAPDLCNFIIPEVISRGPLQVAVSTAGAAPTVVAGIVDRFEHEYGQEWERYLVLIGQLRRLLQERMADTPEKHSLILEAVDDSDVFERVLAGEDPDPVELLIQLAREVDAE
ncbi:MAG: bifunctional precorrin-2 dehydrogenase/sirohydrochlorin ferrochelatase [Actinomycetota bacterium]|jgi:precorrin-2 dehydrogenase/sirohydrochlorin ferrochelatase|nr:bifunctional precorrin-2 dehydrogenase/sirohydrochlorin ferrochelatase [Actinomycetota bacterium]